jgi:hypothetical protein
MYNYLKPLKISFFYKKQEDRRVEQVLSGSLEEVGMGRMWGEAVGG